MNTFRYEKKDRVVLHFILSLAVIVGILYYWNFSFLAQLYLIIGALVCTYQLLIIAGKTGLAPFPRFATFIMMPGVILLGFDALQVTFVSTFIEVCGGVAVDLLFGRVMARHLNVSSRRIKVYQIIGTCVSICFIGCILWLLVTRFQLGTPELFAQRAHFRALLLKVFTMNYLVVALGVAIGFILYLIRINSAVVVGGLAMPLEVSLMLIVGGMITLFIKEPEEHYPFWSGVFAMSTLLLLSQAL